MQEPGQRREEQMGTGGRRASAEARGSRAGRPQTAFARQAVTVPGAALPLRPASGQVISLRPTVTGPRCSQLEGGWVDILRESSLFFLTEPSQASIHGGVPRHLPAPQLPEVTGHTSPAASTDVLAQCFQK